MRLALILILVVLGVCFVASQKHETEIEVNDLTDSLGELRSRRKREEDCSWVQAALTGAIAGGGTGAGIGTIAGPPGIAFGAFWGMIFGSVAGVVSDKALFRFT